MLETQNNNVAACALYESCGFTLEVVDFYLYKGLSLFTDVHCTGIIFFFINHIEKIVYRLTLVDICFYDPLYKEKKEKLIVLCKIHYMVCRLITIDAGSIGLFIKGYTAG